MLLSSGLDFFIFKTPLGCFCLKFYGLFLVFALFTCSIFASFDKRFKPLFRDFSGFFNFLSIVTFSVVLGGRLLFFISHFSSQESWFELFNVFSGGLTLLGGILTGLASMFAYCWFYNLSFFNYANFVGTYASLFHAIARLGCFFCGCCFGAHYKWLPEVFSVVYTNPESFAPINIALFPTQLLSAIFSFAIFIVLFFYRYSQNLLGKTLFCYLILESLNRVILDWTRASREIFFWNFSVSQVIGFLIIILTFFIAYFSCEKVKQ